MQHYIIAAPYISTFKILLLPVISHVKLRYIYTGNRVFVFTVGLVATSGDYLRQQLARSIAIADLRSTP